MYALFRSGGDTATTHGFQLPDENFVMKHDGSPKILVVDDDATNRLVVRVLMERRRCTVVEAWSGKSALNAVKWDDFDTILMDLSMPSMDGLETTKYLREGKGLLQSIPIFGLSAHTARRDVAKCLNSGMNYVLRKPFCSDGADQLLALISRTTFQMRA